MTFEIQAFCTELQKAVTATNAESAVEHVLAKAVADPLALANAAPEFAGDEQCVLEEPTLSVYWVKFFAGSCVPPHEHKMSAFIGVYQGVEVNRLYQRSGEQLTLLGVRRVNAGETLTIAPDGIHDVYPGNGKESRALHVYLGNLTGVERSLFHPETGAAIPFSAGALRDHTRPAPE